MCRSLSQSIIVYGMPKSRSGTDEEAKKRKQPLDTLPFVCYDRAIRNGVPDAGSPRLAIARDDMYRAWIADQSHMAGRRPGDPL